MQIEEGKYYRAKSGKKVGPMTSTSGDRSIDRWRGYIDGSGLSYWHDNGSQWSSRESPNDLVAEWVDEPSLKIEEGSWYITAGEGIVGPMIGLGGGIFCEHGRIAKQWREDGTYWNGMGDNGENRIVRKWTGPTPSTSVALVSEPAGPDYEPLEAILCAALAQAASGKGKERHANGKDFIRQPIMEIGRMVGPGYQTGQAMKKAQEAMGMVARDQHDRAEAELLGAINYLAAAILLIRETSGKFT